VNNFSTIGSLDRGKGIEYCCMPGRVTAGQAKAGLLVLVTVLSFTQPVLPSGDEGGDRLSQNSPRNSLIMIDVRAPEGTAQETILWSLSSYTK
jgi:hypothetical protein